MYLLQTQDVQAMDRLLARLDELHTAPSAALRILELTRSPDYDLEEVVRLMEREPALAARVLRTVNSAHFGLGKPIGSLRQAVGFLGSRSLRLLALTFSVVARLTEGAAARLCSEFWTRAVSISTAARLLAAWDRAVDPFVAHATGLLLDLGVLALAQGEGEPYVEVYRACEHGPGLTAAELACYGFDHARLGGHMLARWGFPDAMVQTVTLHHEDVPAPEPLQVCLRNAEMLADVLHHPHSPRLGPLRRALARFYGIDLDGFIDLALLCKEAMAEQAELLQVRLAGKIDCERVAAAARRQYADAALETAIAYDSLEHALTDPSAN
jgi:HD-like signal output (HDOD) protein